MDTLQKNMEDVACLSLCYLLCVRPLNPIRIIVQAANHGVKLLWRLLLGR
jgi:hypothetical protein